MLSMTVNGTIHGPKPSNYNSPDVEDVCFKRVLL